MTAGTGKRQYRACQRCRSRKTRCDLETVGEPSKPPCLECYRSGNECVLADSRRGGNYKRHGKSHVQPGSNPVGAPSVGSDHDARHVHREIHMSSGNDLEEGSDEEPASELRNPSDALHILAQSEKDRADVGCEAQQVQRLPTNLSNDEYESRMSSQPSHGIRGASILLDEYELVKRGLLFPGMVVELLLVFHTNYHPYFPIAPSYLCGSSALQKTKRADFFLLTVMLTIASRDREDFTLVHRYCWDHTQRLLLDVLLAQPWTQTPRTVEALLLLSEWLPHIPTQTTSAKQQTKNPLSDDRTAWSIIGQAVRHAYLLKLDRAAFRGESLRESKDLADHKRLVWTFVYIADRQISVRLGQSFWSRGPSLSSRFTAKDFPSLQPQNDKDEDYSSVHQATLELTQILHNAHDVLYSSRARTLALVFAGDYNRYLDDFQQAAASWHAEWSDVPRTRLIKTALSLMYDYLGVYVNAFSFQAVMTRFSSSQAQTAGREQHSLSDDSPFAAGVMATPDGRYIFDAFTSARKILHNMSNIPPEELCYLPTRYHLYGVYAAVFVYKAEMAGAIRSDSEQEATTSLIMRFIAALANTGSNDLHVARQYGKLLQKMWQGKQRPPNMRRRGPPDPAATPHSRRQEAVSQNDVDSADQIRSMHGQIDQELSSLEFPPSQLADSDIGLLDSQLFDPFWTDFSDLQPFETTQGLANGYQLPWS